MRMTTRQWSLFVGVFACLAVSAALLVDRVLRAPASDASECPPVAPPDAEQTLAAGALERIIGDSERHGMDMTRYWAAVDVASLDALRSASAASVTDVKTVLTTLPVPDRIRLTVVHISETGRFLLIGHSDPERASDGGYLAVLGNHTTWGWQLCGSMRLTPGSRFWGIWLDARGKWLAAAWADEAGHVLRVRPMDTEGSCEEVPTFDFAEGFPEPTREGILVRHLAPSAWPGTERGNRVDPNVVSPFGPRFSRSEPEVYTLVPLEGARRVFP